MSRRVKFAWFLLIGSLINIPLSVFWYARSEPPTVLILSWLAISITAWDVIQSSHARDNTDDRNSE